MSRESLSVSISSGTLVRGIIFVALAVLFFYLRDIFLIVLTSIVIASAVEPAVSRLSKYKIPRVLGVLSVYFVVMAVVSVSFFFFLPPLLEDLSGITQTLPQKVELFGFGVSANKEVLEAGITKLGDALFVSDILGSVQDAVKGVSGGLLSAASSIFGGTLSLVLILVLSFYFAVLETGIEQFIRIVVPAHSEDYVAGLWKRSQEKIGLWMQGQVLLALIVGVLVYLGLSIIGVPYALLLALFAAIMELVPVFGPVISAIPAILLGFSDGGVSIALAVLALFVIVQQFENHLIYPLVVQKVVGVPPLLVILALIVGAKLGGILGIILSVPVAAALREYLDDIQKAKRRASNTSS